MTDLAFWKNKRVFVTGHSGFKGTWLTLWLEAMGAEVTGFSLPPTDDWAPRDPSVFGPGVRSIWGDIRDEKAVGTALAEAAPDIVLHLAAQPLVLRSYQDPIEAFSMNVTGLSNVLHHTFKTAARVVLNVTSDKCYENREWEWPYRETDPLGGHDPYSASKGCAEIVTSSFYRSYYKPAERALLSARAGNVVGGGDEAPNRIVPDIIRAIRKGGTLTLRHPKATRPWQHVLEPLCAYLMLIEKSWNNPTDMSRGWNVGPNSDAERTVEEVAKSCFTHWGVEPRIEIIPGSRHEAGFLKLDSSLIRRKIAWRPQLGFDETMAWSVEWYRDHKLGTPARDLYLRQIERFRAKGSQATEKPNRR